MKKIRPRRNTLRINSPATFGVLCALILLLVAGAAFGLAAGVVSPAVEMVQARYATPVPSPTVTPVVVTPVPATPTPSIDPSAPADPNVPVDPNGSPLPEETPEPTPTPVGKLDGRVIAIDAAKSKGAKYKGVSTKTPEYKINYAFAVRVKELLEAEGATVIMTRDSESEVVGHPARIKTVNNSEAEICISIMCNYIDAGGTRGAQMIVPKGHKKIDSCSSLAKSVLNAYVKATDMPTREVSGTAIRKLGNWETLNGVKCPVTAIILGHISNKTDDKNLNSEDFINSGAKGIVNGVINYFNNK